MRYFKDEKGDTWGVDLTVGSLLRVKTATGFDLIDKPDSMPQNLAALVDILWVTLEPQLTAKGVSQEDFAERLGGDSLEAAIDCFMEEWADFFRKLAPSRATVIRGLWRKAREHTPAMAAQIERALSTLSFDLPESRG